MPRIIAPLEVLSRTNIVATELGAGATINLSKYRNPVPLQRFYLVATAVTGTAPTLDVALGVTKDAQFCSISSWTQATAAGGQVEDETSATVAVIPSNVEFNLTIAGTAPDFTFKIYRDYEFDE